MRILACLLLVCLIAACGQKGPLFLEEKTRDGKTNQPTMPGKEKSSNQLVLDQELPNKSASENSDPATTRSSN
tara:strand:+ start:52403 stop:52621 length:219 start_codon:yes stop_codon:yes gene_type:complete